MDSANQIVAQKRWFSVRPKFLAGCAAAVSVLFLPDIIALSYALKLTTLGLATSSILSGWFLLLMDGGPKQIWRYVLATIAAIYLVISLPVFLFEISQIRWLMRHPWAHWFSMYVRPWVHLGFVLIFLSIIFSYFGQGRARLAFVTGSLLLLVLRLATDTWLF